MGNAESYDNPNDDFLHEPPSHTHRTFHEPHHQTHETFHEPLHQTPAYAGSSMEHNYHKHQSARIADSFDSVDQVCTSILTLIYFLDSVICK